MRERVSNIPGINRWWSCTRYPDCRGKIREYAGTPAAAVSGATKCPATPNLAALEDKWAVATVLPEPAPAATAPRRTPSKYQQAIFDWIRTGTGHAVVEAVAGSGKTTTMVDALAMTSGKVLFTAFNAAIARELNERAPAHVTVSTLHSLGLKAIRKAYPGVEVDKDSAKLEAACLAQFPEKPTPSGDANLEIRRLAAKTAALVKATLTPTNDLDALMAMMERYGVDFDEAEDAVRVAQSMSAILSACADTSRVDFDDMVWYPVMAELNVEKYDWIFVDETQDMNRAQLELVLRAAHATTRIVCVGDRSQSIYGFRGADTRAIPTIIERLGAKVFPLSITYRCPVSHVREAQKLVPHIEARPDAPEGKIDYVALENATVLMAPGDLVMCRTNAPLATVAFALIREGKKAVIRGREIGAGLKSLVRKLAGRSNDLGHLLTRLAEYHGRERNKLTLARKSTLVLDDKVETISVLSEGAADVRALQLRIDTIFSDDGNTGVVCSSVHRAKGLEADRTFILSPELMPHPSAKRDWELEQESNIRYVALTRSRREMYFVSMPEVR
jgi:DNA helicase-2/ATP-dependent DNA helicase PcrA